MENYELSYEEIENKAKEIFGQNFSKGFPKEGNDSFEYQEDTQTYIATEIETDLQEDDFLLDYINKTENNYEVTIIEYLADYSNENTIIVRNTNEEEIGRVGVSEGETKIQEMIKNNKDKFTTKKITIAVENNQFIIQKVER